MNEVDASTFRGASRFLPRRTELDVLFFYNERIQQKSLYSIMYLHGAQPQGIQVPSRIFIRNLSALCLVSRLLKASVTSIKKPELLANECDTQKVKKKS